MFLVYCFWQLHAFRYVFEVLSGLQRMFYSYELKMYVAKHAFISVWNILQQNYIDKIICSCTKKHYYKWNKISCIYTLYWNINKLVKFSIRLFALAKLKKNDFLGTWNTINATMHFKMQCNFFNATIDIILFTILHQGKF